MGVWIVVETQKLRSKVLLLFGDLQGCFVSRAALAAGPPRVCVGGCVDPGFAEFLWE